MIRESLRYLWEKVKDAGERHRIVPYFLHEEKFSSVNKTVKYPASHSSRKSDAIEIDTDSVSLILTMVLF